MSISDSFARDTGILVDRTCVVRIEQNVLLWSAKGDVVGRVSLELSKASEFRNVESAWRYCNKDNKHSPYKQRCTTLDKKRLLGYHPKDHGSK